MHNGPSLESQLVAHIELVMEEDEQTSLGPTIDEGHTYVQGASREVVFADIGHQEELGLDKAISQVTSGPVEHGVFQSDQGDYFGDNRAPIFGSTH